MRVTTLFAIGPRIRSVSSSFLTRRLASSTADSKNEVFDISMADEKPIFVIEDEQEQNLSLLEKRNKSGLRPQHRNMLLGVRPYNESKTPYHDSLKYKRRLLGRYGTENSGVPVHLAWPTLEEIEDIKEYEKVAYPLSIQETWKEIEKKHREEAEELEQRQKRIVENVAKLEGWKRELNKKIAAKEKEALAAKERKDRLVEEVRRYFGFKMNPKDERFKQMLEHKELEQRKLKKEAKKKARSEKMHEWVRSSQATEKTNGDDKKTKNNDATEKEV